MAQKMSDQQRAMPQNFSTGDDELPKPGMFICRNTERPKRKAKRLKRALQEAGYDVRLQKCLELIAQMYGYANYHELHYSIDGVTCSPDDEAGDEARFSARFWSQVEKLVEIGVSPQDAEHIIDMVRPTSGTYKPADDVSPSEPLSP
jgi:hypothetical protein